MRNSSIHATLIVGSIISIILITVSYSKYYIRLHISWHRWGGYDGIGPAYLVGSPRRHPMDTEFISANFNELKKVIGRTASGNRGQAEKLMKHMIPLIDTGGWRLHSPSDWNYSRKDIESKIAADATADNLPVPNVAHFILPFGDANLHFHQAVCILSCVWITKPALLFLWYVRLPSGQNWDLLKTNLTAAGFWESRVILAHRDAPNSVYGLPVRAKEHKSDIMRLEALLVFGGVYFDLDVISLKSLEPLRRFNFTIGRQSIDGLCNAVFLAAPNSTFLSLWHLAYQTFDARMWSTYSVNLPHHMFSSAAFKSLCHVEEDSLVRPTWNKPERDWIYEKARKWDWRSKNYAMHLWYRFHDRQYNMSSIMFVDSMLGDMFRFILFGNSSMMIIN